MKHKFGILWTQPWPYDPSAGVGLEFRGRPQDGAERFVKALAQHGCHPEAGRRIFDRLAQSGITQCTVTNTLDFVAINNAVIEQGTTMMIIPPQEGWVQNFYDGAWPEGYQP